MTDDPRPTKVTPNILVELNRYGSSYPFDGVTVTDPPDLPSELRERGVVVTERDAELLRDEELWPAQERAAVVAIVAAAEQYGVRYEVTFTHEPGQPLGLGVLGISLSGS